MTELELPASVQLSLPNKEDLMHFDVTIVPDEGYWKGATFVFAVDVPDDYPHKPPKVTCKTKARLHDSSHPLNYID
jgi:ubiquitin-conjugating enzyme E2 M